MSGARVPRLQLAQEMMPVYVLMDAISPLTPILTLTPSGSPTQQGPWGVRPGWKAPPGSQRLRDYSRGVSYQPP